MATNTTSTPSTSTSKGAGDVSASSANAGETERSFDVSAAQGAIADLTRRFERILQEGIESLRSHSRTYVDSAGEQFGAAQQYVSEKVKERPVAATMAGLGVGVLIGMLIAGGRRKH